MIPASNVELTKVSYYDKNKSHRNIEIPSISREVYQNHIKENTIIKRNIFGHTWVLKINETNDSSVKEKCDAKVIVYAWVFCCIFVAVCFGIYFSMESKFSNNKINVTSNVVPTQNENVSMDSNNFFNSEDVRGNNGSGPNDILKSARNSDEGDTDADFSTDQPMTDQTTTFQNVCSECNKQEEVCIKIDETEMPNCVTIIDRKDPTGCGGICKINIQHCRLLDRDIGVYQCTKNTHMLHCPDDSFNCGNRCISLNQRCDGVIHCSNQSDEQNCDCNPYTEFHCGNQTSCISKTKRCDRIVDCWDRSDEIGCHKACAADEAPCHSGHCIKKEHICDGVYHCTDKSDEPEGC